MQCLLISRFLINLRLADQGQSRNETDHLSKFTTPAFRVPTMQEVADDMGQSLEYSEDVQDNDLAQDEEGSRSILSRISRTSRMCDAIGEY